MQNKKLSRSQNEKILAGVAGGLGKYFEIDPLIIRIIFIFLTLFHGFGLLLYLILALIVPSEEGSDNLKSNVGSFAKEVREKAEIIKNKGWWNRKRNIIGLIIIVIGLVFLIDIVLPLSFSAWGIIWPLIIIFIGFYLIFNKKNHERR